MTRVLGPTCPRCRSTESSVVDTRPNPSGEIRRRRECPKGHRYTTYEAIDATRGDVDPQKLRAIAEKWSVLPCSVRISGFGSIHAPVLIRMIADAMDEAVREGA